MENQRTNPAHTVRKNLYALTLRTQKRFQVLTVVHSGIRDHVLTRVHLLLMHKGKSNVGDVNVSGLYTGTSGYVTINQILA